MKPDFGPLDRDAKIVLSELTGVDFTYVDMANWFCATARDDEGRVLGVLACEPQNSFDWRFSVAILDPVCLSRRVLRTIFTTLFTRAARVTALVDPDNEQAEYQARRMGFVYEGFLRRGLDGRRDAMIFGMLPEDCPWLRRQGKKRSVPAIPHRMGVH